MKKKLVVSIAILSIVLMLVYAINNLQSSKTNTYRAPIGTSQIISFGKEYIVTNPKMEILTANCQCEYQVEDIMRGKEAMNIIVEGYYDEGLDYRYMKYPDSGFEYLLVKVKEKYISSDVDVSI